MKTIKEMLPELKEGQEIWIKVEVDLIPEPNTFKGLRVVNELGARFLVADETKVMLVQPEHDSTENDNFQHSQYPIDCCGQLVEFGDVVELVDDGGLLEKIDPKLGDKLKVTELEIDEEGEIFINGFYNWRFKLIERNGQAIK